VHIAGHAGNDEFIKEYLELARFMDLQIDSGQKNAEQAGAMRFAEFQKLLPGRQLLGQQGDKTNEGHGHRPIAIFYDQIPSREGMDNKKPCRKHQRRNEYGYN